MPEAAGAPVVVLSSIDWDAAWQRHQIFSSLFARAGRRVYFVENLGFREPRVSDWRRVKARLERLTGPGASRAPRPDGVSIVSPAVLPPTRELFRKVNEALLAPRLARKLRFAGLSEAPVVVCYLPTATTLSLLDELSPKAVVYDCVDNFAGHPTPPAGLAETERALLERADVVLTTSPTLRAALEAKHAKVVELHQGVPESFFLDARGRAPARRLAYFGTVWSALDLQALGALAAAGFEVELIGPVKEDIVELPPGVVSLPPVPHAELPKYLRSYDALLLPYAKTSYNEGVTPAKLYECLATGLPVLAAPLPALAGLKDILTFASTPEEWVRAARGAGVDDENRRERRLALAREHRQSAVFARLSALVDEASAAAKPAPPRRPLTRTRAFLEAVAPLGALTLSARLTALATFLAAGRWLGPGELGRAAGAAALASGVAVLPQLGLPAALSRGLAHEPDERRQGALVATSLAVCLAAAAAWLTVLGGLRERLVDALGVSEGLFDLGLVLGYASAVAVVAESALIGLARFARRGAMELVSAVLLPVLFFALSGSRPGHEALILAWAGGLFAAAGLSALSLLPRFAFRFEPPVLRQTLPYWPAALGSLAAGTLLFAPQPLMLARADSWSAAGLFAAYACATTALASALAEPVSLALGRVADAPLEGAPWRALGWKGAFRALLAAPVLMLASFAAFAALGDQFPFSWATGARFAAAGALTAALAALAARADAGGLQGARYGAAGRLVAGLSNVLLAQALIPSRGLNGAAEALALASACGLLWFAALDAIGRSRE